MNGNRISSKYVFNILAGWVIVGIAVVVAASGGIFFPRWVPFMFLAGIVLLGVAGLAYYQNETNGAVLTLPQIIGWALFVGAVFWLSRLV